MNKGPTKPKLERRSVRIRGRKSVRARGKKGAPGKRASVSKSGYPSDIVFTQYEF